MGNALAFLMVLLILVLWPGNVQAKKELSVSASLFEGELAVNAFSRLDIRVTNGGGEDFRGSVQVDFGGKYVREAFVEAGKSGALAFYLPPLAYRYGAANTDTVKIFLLNESGRTVDQAVINSTGAYTNKLLVGILGKGIGEYRRISNALPYFQVVNMGVQDLDFLPFAENFRVIIISEPAVFSAEQTENLRRWLEGGGLLITSGSSILSGSTLPPDVLPFRFQGTEIISGPGLASLGFKNLDGGYTIVTGEATGRILAQGDGKPLLVAKEMGRGAVVWSALDLEAAPLTDATQAETFWPTLFRLGMPADMSNVYEGTFMTILLNGISYDSLAASISPGKLFLLLVGYIVLVGPVNWLILRKIDRREWAWFIIPAAALLLTGGTYLYGRFGRGSDKVLYQVNIVQPNSASAASVRSLSGLFIPRAGKISLSSASDLLPLDEGITAKVELGQKVLEVKDAPLWSVQKFFGAQQIPLQGSVVIEARAKKIWAANNSGQDFFASYLKVGSDWYSFGPLAAGVSKQASGHRSPDVEEIWDHFNGRGWHWQDFSDFIDSSVYFLGFGETGLMEIAGADRQVALDIWAQPVSLESILTRDSVNIPERLLLPQVTGPSLVEGGYEFYFSGAKDASADLVFELPPGLDYTKGEYRFVLEAVRGDVSEVEVLLFSGSDGQWQAAGMLNLHGHSAMRIENVDDYVVGNRLMVRLKFEGDLFLPRNGAYITVDGGGFND